MNLEHLTVHSTAVFWSVEVSLVFLNRSKIDNNHNVISVFDVLKGCFLFLVPYPTTILLTRIRMLGHLCGFVMSFQMNVKKAEKKRPHFMSEACLCIRYYQHVLIEKHPARLTYHSYHEAVQRWTQKTKEQSKREPQEGLARPTMGFKSLSNPEKMGTGSRGKDTI